MDKVEKFLSKETKRKEKYKVKFLIFFETHHSKRSVEQLPELIKEADIYIPEEPGWTQEYLHILQGISRGYFTEKDMEIFEKTGCEIVKYFKANEKIRKKDITKLMKIKPFKTYTKRMKFYWSTILENLLGSGKIISFIDIPYESDIYARDSEIYKDLIEISYGFYPPTEDLKFEDLLDKLNNVAKEISEIIVSKREEIMLSNIPKTISEIIQNNPHLEEKAKKDGIKVLIVLGAAHTAVLHYLKREGIKLENFEFSVESKFEKIPFVYPFFEKIVIRYRFGKEVSRELLAKALAEIMFFRQFERSRFFSLISSESMSDLAAYIRDIINPATFDDIKQLYEEIKNIYKKHHKNPKKAKKLASKVWLESIKEWRERGKKSHLEKN